MNATLLCPGPSLAGHAHSTGGVVVAVNRAATYHACDVWVCGDAPLIQQVHEQVLGSPELITSVDGHSCCSNFRRDFGRDLWSGPFRCWTEALSFCPHAYQWPMFSATAALVWTGFGGAKRIDVFGADWSGVEDFDGEKAGLNRTEERWKLERQIWGNLVGWMKLGGIEVVRHVA